ncbi:hypothetical protein GQ85_35295, partial [Rhodococcus rhodochrous]
AAALRAGTAPEGPAVPARPAQVLTDDEQRRENVWLGLSDALDQVDPSDREGFLVRLALQLGAQAGHREFEEAIAAATDTSPVRTEELAPQA